MSDTKKYVLFDKQREEYVVAEGQTVFLERLVYETSKRIENAMLYQQKTDEATLSTLEKKLEYPSNSFEWREAPQETIEADEVRRLLEKFENISYDLADHEKEKKHEILDRMLNTLSNIDWTWGERISDMQDWANFDDDDDDDDDE